MFPTAYQYYHDVCYHYSALGKGEDKDIAWVVLDRAVVSLSARLFFSLIGPLAFVSGATNATLSNAFTSAAKKREARER